MQTYIHTVCAYTKIRKKETDELIPLSYHWRRRIGILSLSLSLSVSLYLSCHVFALGLQRYGCSRTFDNTENEKRPAVSYISSLVTTCPLGHTAWFPVGRCLDDAEPNVGFCFVSILLVSRKWRKLIDETLQSRGGAIKLFQFYCFLDIVNQRSIVEQSSWLTMWRLHVFTWINIMCMSS